MLGHVGFGQHQDVRLHFVQCVASLFPKGGGAAARHIAAKSVDVEFLHPPHQVGREVVTHLGIRKIQHWPAPVAKFDLAIRVVDEEVRPLHQHAVKRGVIEDHVEHDLQPALVRLSGERLQIRVGAVFGIDRVVVADVVRPTVGQRRTLRDGAQIQHVHTEFGQMIEPRGHARQCSFGAERPQPDVIDDGATHPFGHRARFARGRRGAQQHGRRDRPQNDAFREHCQMNLYSPGTGSGGAAIFRS